MQPTFVTRLLQRHHRQHPFDAERENIPSLSQAEYFCEVGLGPIAFELYGDALKSSGPAAHAKLQSAALTTRVIYSQLESAAVELVKELQSTGVVPTLLKGISASDEFYDPPHLRLMCDVDILIRSSEVDLVLSKVESLGYEITEEQWRKYREHGHHHLPQARHPESGVYLEVHTELFGPSEFYVDEYVFQRDNIEHQRVEVEYKGLRVARFTPEFQFVYTISKWSVDRDWAINLKNINDTIHILKKYESTFEWPRLSTWFAANPHLYPITTVLLRYLEQVNLIAVSPQMCELLASSDQTLGPLKQKLLMWILHTYPFNAHGKNENNYKRWFAHAFWLMLSKSSSRNLGISREIFRQFRMNAVHGKYNPVRRIKSGFKAYVGQLKKP